MTRSFSYAADAALLLRGIEAPEGWVDACRDAFVEGYLSLAEERILPPSRAGFDRLLALYELEKLVYELHYEARNRPDWASIPVVGLAADAGDGAMSLPGELDLHLIGEGRHERLWEQLGAHALDDDAACASPSGRRARAASPSSATGTTGARTPTRSTPQGSSGVWAGLVRERARRARLQARGARLRRRDAPQGRPARVPGRGAAEHGLARLPVAPRRGRTRPGCERREATDPLTAPLSIYELHPGSWRQGLGWRDLADELAEHVTALGFTHVELLPVMQHPVRAVLGLPGLRASTLRTRRSASRTTCARSSTSCTRAGSA